MGRDTANEELELRCDPVVHEWDDGSRLEQAVERLADERRAVVRIRRLGRLVVLVPLLAMASLAVCSELARAAGANPVLTIVCVAPLLLMAQLCMQDELAREAERRRGRIALGTREVQRRLEASEWLQVPRP